MNKNEIETRYQHKYPGHKPLHQLNNKFRDMDINPKKSTQSTFHTQSFRTMGRPTAGNPVRGWDLGETSQGPRWTQRHWERQTKTKSDFEPFETEENFGKTSMRLGGKNLRIKNIDGRMKQRRLYSSMARVNPKTDAYFYPNPSFLIHPCKYHLV